jgi:hypothetical protein
MGATEPFYVFDCGLIRRATGRVCVNLRDLLDAIYTAPESVLEHHMMRCALEDHFELHEFPNDLARWCWDGLGDHVLGEQLGLVDPYLQPSVEALRGVLANAIEDRLWGLERAPWCRAGMELYLVDSRLIAYDTGERVSTPAALLEAVERMPLRSIFYHVHDARRRSEGRADDFSLWLEANGSEPSLVEKIRGVDFYFLNLTQLREAIVDAFRQYRDEAPSMARTAT